jgi:hypothetical protein
VDPDGFAATFRPLPLGLALGTFAAPLRPAVRDDAPPLALRAGEDVPFPRPRREDRGFPDAGGPAETSAPSVRNLPEGTSCTAKSRVACSGCTCADLFFVGTFLAVLTLGMRKTLSPRPFFLT